MTQGTTEGLPEATDTNSRPRTSAPDFVTGFCKLRRSCGPSAGPSTGPCWTSSHAARPGPSAEPCYAPADQHLHKSVSPARCPKGHSVPSAMVVDNDIRHTLPTSGKDSHLWEDTFSTLITYSLIIILAAKPCSPPTLSNPGVMNWFTLSEFQNFKTHCLACHLTLKPFRKLSFQFHTGFIPPPAPADLSQGRKMASSF